MKKRTAWPLHILGGLCFLLIPLILAPQPEEVSRFALDRHTIQELMANALMLLFFYLNYFFLIPAYFLQKKYLVYAAWVIGGFLLILIIPELLAGSESSIEPRPAPPMRPDGKLAPMPQPPSGLGPNRDFGPAPMNFWDQLFPWSELASYSYQFLLFAVVVLFSNLLRLREALFSTEQAKSKAEIGSLKSQINPHFLFNSLNSIYALSIRENADKTGEGLMKLSTMMRYVVTESSDERVSLEKEITYLENYLELQKLRLPSGFQFRYQKDGIFQGYEIAPLLLIPFVENAFKHGVNPDENGEIVLKISHEQQKFEMVVENKIVVHPLPSHEESGMGLENTKSRLQLIYGDQHRLEIGESKEYFRVHLLINFEC